MSSAGSSYWQKGLKRTLVKVSKQLRKQIYLPLEDFQPCLYLTKLCRIVNKDNRIWLPLLLAKLVFVEDKWSFSYHLYRDRETVGIRNIRSCFYTSTTDSGPLEGLETWRMKRRRLTITINCLLLFYCKCLMTLSKDKIRSYVNSSSSSAWRTEIRNR